MNEIKGGGAAEVLSDDLNVITAEINAYQRVAGEAIFEIGRRLKYVKENDLVHGEFGKWSESIGIHPTDASRFIKVYDEVGGSKLGTYTNLGLKALYLIATLPSDQRDQPHTIPSTGESKTVDEMTVRELREVKKALKEAEEARKQAEAQRDMAQRESDILRDTLESREDVEPEVRTEYVYIEKEPETQSVKTVSKENRKQFYEDFIEELEYIRCKYAAIVAEAPELRKSIEQNESLCDKLDNFDDFWKGFAKAIYKNNTIIEMGN